MADEFSLSDAVSGGSVTNNPVGNPQQNPNWSANPWGQYPGAPGAGQAYPGAPGAGQAYPGAPGAGQAYPGAPGAGQAYPGFPGAGQAYPGVPGAGPAYPGAPGGGQGFPGQQGPGAFPMFPGGGQPFPGFSGPGSPATGPTAPQPTPPVGPMPKSGGPLKVPYDLSLSAGVVPRLVIEVYGTVKDNPKRFVMDFKRQNDIVFHFNPRFDESKKVIVRNSMIRDSWGSEERQANKFPFEAGKPFKIQILCDTDNFKVAVNGEHTLQFNYREKKIDEIKTVSICGDITLSDVKSFMV